MNREPVLTLLAGLVPFLAIVIMVVMFFCAIANNGINKTVSRDYLQEAADRVSR